MFPGKVLALSEQGAPQMKIRVEVRNVYGIETVYPMAGCSMAEGFAAIAGTKTLTHQALQIIEAMGFTIEVMPQSLPRRGRRA